MWHIRFGHPSLPVLSHIPCIKFSQHDADVLDIQACETCHCVKQHRTHFPLKECSIVAVFELIHMDVWEPYVEENLIDCHYMLTVVDDFSRGAWCYLFKHKIEVPQLIQNFLPIIKTQFNTKVKIIRTDNGTEFVGKYTEHIFNSFGIVHQKTCVHTPQQNGVVERKHKHLLEIARALMFQASLPQKFWHFSLLAATYLVNRLPTPTLDWKTPYSILFHKEPDYTLLKLFGCLVFAANTAPHKSKFASRGSKCICLGYTITCKGYNVYDLETGKLFVTRDAHFFEHVYPFQHIDPDPQYTYLPIVHLPEEDDSSIPLPSVSDQPSTSTTSLSTIVHVSDPPLGRGCRIKSKPAWMSDFVTETLANHTTNYVHSLSPSFCLNPTNYTPHAFSFLVPPNITYSYMHYLPHVSILHEPSHYNEAVAHTRWTDAMSSELDSIEFNGAWKVADLPPNKQVIGCKWIYKVKLHADGTVDRYKARLVAKGYDQNEGIDFTEIFSPVAKLVTVRMVIALATTQNWSLHHIDVNNAFLHGHLDDEIYMTPPPDNTEAQPGQVLKLLKNIYGLKQPSRQWNL